MSDLNLKDLMIPAEDYASVPLGASILEGILALKAAQHREFSEDPERHRDRAVLVTDAHGEVVGKLSPVLAIPESQLLETIGSRRSGVMAWTRFTATSR